jgi:hypothetical protein
VAAAEVYGADPGATPAIELAFHRRHSPNPVPPRELVRVADVRAGGS